MPSRCGDQRLKVVHYRLCDDSAVDAKLSPHNLQCTTCKRWWTTSARHTEGTTPPLPAIPTTKRWRYNDSVVTTGGMDKVLTSSAYFLSYVKPVRGVRCLLIAAHRRGLGGSLSPPPNPHRRTAMINRRPLRTACVG